MTVLLGPGYLAQVLLDWFDIRNAPQSNRGMESKFRVVLLDAKGFNLGERPADNLKQARDAMRYLLSGQFAVVAETSHTAMGTHKAEVRNAKDECVLDAFLSVQLVEEARG